MKKFLKYLMVVGFLIVVFLVSFSISYVIFDSKATFNKQKEVAINCVEENYVEEFELIDARDVNFNAGFSEFYFYNKENDFYFSVSVTAGPKHQGMYAVDSSDYEEQKKGSLISKEIKEKFSDLEFIISTSYDHINKTGHMWIKLLQDGRIDDEKEYEFLRYIVENYENVNIEYFLLDKKVYNDYKKSPLNHITANAGFDYESHIDIIYGDEVYHWIKDASEFDYEMYLKLKKFDEYLNDDSDSIANPFQ